MTIDQIHDCNASGKNCLQKCPTDLAKKLISTYVEENRKLKIGLFLETSRTLKGQQSIPNRLLFMLSISFPRNSSEKLSDDKQRIKNVKDYYKVWDNFSLLDRVWIALWVSLVDFFPGGASASTKIPVFPTHFVNSGWLNSLQSGQVTFYTF